MNDGRCMMLRHKDGSLIRVPREKTNLVCFQRTKEHGMDNFIDMGLGNYSILEDIFNKKTID